VLVYWIWLSRCKGLSGAKKLALCARYGDPRGVWESGGYDTDLSQAEKILEDCRRKGVQILTAGDASYPRRLLDIADPPLVLYYKGRLPQFDREAAIGVVGTRNASAYGLMAAEKLAREISLLGGLVVSGMAAGIDAQAGWGAVRAGCPAVGVLGGGVDVIYPSSNRDLYEAVERNGCLISEYPPGTPPGRWTFPQRNRIISGLSVAVLAVEAPERSGTMITVRDAQKQGRDLFAVPGNIDSPTCAGTNGLLQNGAQAATCGMDVMRHYEGKFPDRLHREPAPVIERAPAPKAAPKALGATAEEQAVLDALGEGERNYDQIISASGLSSDKAMAVLTMLEIKGMVKTLPGRRAIRTM